MKLVCPAVEYLPDYVAALGRGWSPDDVRGGVAAREELERIAVDPALLALRELLPEARREGLRYVEIVTDPDNIASQRVIEANGGELVEEFVKPAMYGHAPGLRYRIQL